MRSSVSIRDNDADISNKGSAKINNGEDSKLSAQLQLFSGLTIDVPSCYIAGSNDWGIYQSPGSLERMKKTACTKMLSVNFVKGAGHWVQQEQPNEVFHFPSAFNSARVLPPCLRMRSAISVSSFLMPLSSSAVLPFLLFVFTSAQSIGLPKPGGLCQKRCTSGIALRYAYAPINPGTCSKEPNQSLKLTFKLVPKRVLRSALEAYMKPQHGHPAKPAHATPTQPNVANPSIGRRQLTSS